MSGVHRHLGAPLNKVNLRFMQLTRLMQGLTNFLAEANCFEQGQDAEEALA